MNGAGNQQATGSFVLHQRRDLTVAFFLLGILLILVSLDALVFGQVVVVPDSWLSTLIAALLLAVGAFLLFGGLRHWLRPPVVLVADQSGIELHFDGPSLRRGGFLIPWPRVERVRFVSQPSESVVADVNGRASARDDAFRETVAIVVRPDLNWDPSTHFTTGYDATSRTFAIDALVGQVRGGELFAALSDAQQRWGAQMEQAE